MHCIRAALETRRRKSPLRVTGVGGVSQAPSPRSCHSGKNVNWGKAAAGAHAPHKRQRRPRHDRDREKETAGSEPLGQSVRLRRRAPDQRRSSRRSLYRGARALRAYTEVDGAAHKHDPEGSYKTMAFHLYTHSPTVSGSSKSLPKAAVGKKMLLDHYGDGRSCSSNASKTNGEYRRMSAQLE
ncbi:hypothetical protein MRX96_027011 [Rhipicephalus microplus]